MVSYREAKKFNALWLKNSLFKLVSLNPDRYTLITVDEAVENYRVWLNGFKDNEEYKEFDNWLLTEI